MTSRHLGGVCLGMSCVHDRSRSNEWSRSRGASNALGDAFRAPRFFSGANSFVDELSLKIHPRRVLVASTRLLFRYCRSGWMIPTSGCVGLSARCLVASTSNACFILSTTACSLPRCHKKYADGAPSLCLLARLALCVLLDPGAGAPFGSRRGTDFHDTANDYGSS